MPVILQVCLQSRDRGILAIAFPQTRVLRGPPFPMFLAEHRVVVLSDEQPFRHYADREIIQVTHHAKLVLDSRRGFLKFLRECCGVKITPFQRETFLDEEETDDEQFWREAKLARVNRRIWGIPETSPTDSDPRPTIKDMFETLFEDYGETYRRYRQSRVHHQVAMYSLMTMMERSRKPEGLQRTSRRYREMLVKNRKYRRRYLVALKEYTDNPERENKHISEDNAFLTFLFDCSTDEHLRDRYDVFA